MADEESKEQEAAEGAEAAEAATDDAKGAEASGSDGKPGEEDLTDKHGQEAIAKGRYDRDMKAKDDEIAELRKQIAESAKTEEGRKALEGKIAALEGKQADMRTEYEIKLAGIRDDKALKAAKSMIGDYDGDVSKLKADCPYLFAEEKQKGKTGFKPEGPAGDVDERLDKAFGLKK